MVTFTNTPTEVYGAGNVAKSEVITLLGEIAAAVDASTVSPVAESGSNVTVAAGDGGRLFIQTAASTISLPEISSVSNGFYILVKADTGTTTIDPDGSETIEGAATLALAVSEAARITSDGSEWRTIITRGLGTLGTAAFMADSDVVNLLVDPLAATRRGIAAAAIAAIASQLLGVGQTWQNISASRLANTSYQNTTGRTIGVSVVGNDATNFQVSVDNSTWISLSEHDADTDLGSQGGTHIIPPGYYYRMSGNYLADTWMELR